MVCIRMVGMARLERAISPPRTEWLTRFAYIPVSEAGFEPAASRFQGGVSTRLTYSLVLSAGLEPAHPFGPTVSGWCVCQFHHNSNGLRMH